MVCFGYLAPKENVGFKICGIVKEFCIFGLAKVFVLMKFLKNDQFGVVCCCFLDLGNGCFNRFCFYRR